MNDIQLVNNDGLWKDYLLCNFRRGPTVLSILEYILKMFLKS